MFLLAEVQFHDTNRMKYRTNARRVKIDHGYCTLQTTDASAESSHTYQCLQEKQRQSKKDSDQRMSQDKGKSKTDDQQKESPKRNSRRKSIEKWIKRESNQSRTSHIYHSIENINQLGEQVTELSSSSNFKGVLDTSDVSLTFPLRSSCKGRPKLPLPTDEEVVRSLESVTISDPSLQDTPPAVPPRRSTKDKTVTPRTRHQQKQAKKKSTFKQINLFGYTIKDIGEVLRQLNMSGYVQSFRDAAIDGLILSGLTKDILISEFDMKQFEAIKLMNFVKRGHIPR